MQNNKKDTMYILDGLEVITYLKAEIDTLFYFLSEQKIILPYNVFNVRNMTDNIIKKVILEVMCDLLGYKIICTPIDLIKEFNELYFNNSSINAIVKTICDFIYPIILDVVKLDVNKSYYVDVMTVNNNIHILVNG